MLQPALSLVLEALREIRDSREKPFRVSRATLNRLLESRPDHNVADIAAKAAALGQVRDRVCVCMKCPNLANSRTQTVFGVGNPDAELMFVGEAPGADEDARGEPFVGRAGQLLTKIIGAMGFAREEVYIANILKCRPDTPGSTYGNRATTPTESQTCWPYLMEQIDIIQPKGMVALGATAVAGLLGARATLHRERGKWGAGYG